MTAPQAFHPEFADPAITSATIEVLRQEARSRFETLGFPGRSHEEWRFTPLSPVVGIPFEPAPQAAIDVERWLVPGCRRLVFVNGRLDATLSDLAPNPDGVNIMTLGQTRADSTAIIDAHLGRYARIEDDTFAALNTAQDLEGAFVMPGIHDIHSQHT